MSFRFPIALGLLMLVSGLPLLAQSWKLPSTSRLMGEDRTVEVSPGQSLYDLARANRLALEHLAEANDLPLSLAPVNRDRVLVPGRRIVPLDPPANGLVVNLPERGFYLFRAGEETRFYPIAVGEPGRFETPPGRYAVREKVIDPEWIAPEWAGLGEDNVVPPGPENPLGDRWIGLNSSGLGMHSTNNPSSIGSATSHGCMRMYPEVARTVFDLVEVDWPVTIEYETSRVSVEEGGIYVTCFPDIYSRVDRSAQLRENFSELDLLGFHDLLDAERLLEHPTGVVTRVVDLEPRVILKDGRSFAAARVGEKSYFDGAALAPLGVEQEIRLVEQAAHLRLGDRKVSLPLRFHPAEPLEQRTGQAFLSRGAAWYPAREVLQGLGLVYRWDGELKAITIESPPGKT